MAECSEKSSINENLDQGLIIVGYYKELAISQAHVNFWFEVVLDLVMVISGDK